MSLLKHSSKNVITIIIPTHTSTIAWTLIGARIECIFWFLFQYPSIDNYTMEGRTWFRIFIFCFTFSFWFHFQYPAMDNYTMEGRTYRYPTSEPLFPFGFGLSYSQFVYRSVDIRPKILRFTDPVLVDVYVENKGPYDGDEVGELLHDLFTIFV